MSTIPFGARGPFLVASLPPLKAQSGLGQGWLDTGVTPDIPRIFDGLLYQPGGISPRTGTTGLTLTSTGRKLRDTFTGLGAGVDLSTHTPDFAAPGISYADGPDGTVVGAASGGITSHPGTFSARLVTGIINGLAAAELLVLMAVGHAPAAGGSSAYGFGIVVAEGDHNDYMDGMLYDSTGQNAFCENVVAGTPDSNNIVTTINPGDLFQYVLHGAKLFAYRNGVALGNHAQSASLTGTGVGFIADFQDNLDYVSINDLLICSPYLIQIQGVRPGWAAKLVDSAATLVNEGAENGSGSIFLNTGGYLLTTAGVTGFIQLYTDNTYTTPVAGGRFPEVGNAPAIYPGDVYQWVF